MHGGCQSSLHPSSDCRLPAMVTVAGCAGAGAGPIVRRCDAESYANSVPWQPVATVNGMLGPFDAPSLP